MSPLAVPFDLPCEPISLNLIYPRWLLDPQPLVDEPWIMGAEIQAVSEGIMNPGDRYRNQGYYMMIDTHNSLMEKWDSLQGPDKEVFAQMYRELGEKLLSAQTHVDERDQRVPRRLPDVVKQPDVARFTGAPKTKRGMTALEAANAETGRQERQTKRARKDRAIEAANAVELVEAKKASIEYAIELNRTGARVAAREGLQTVVGGVTGEEDEEEEEAIPASTGRSARIRRPTKKAASQARQEAEEKEKQGRKKGRAKQKKTPIQLEELLQWE